MEETAERKERRRIPRFRVDFPVILIWEGTNFHCHARQLSEAGMLLASTPQDLIGEQIQLELGLVSRRPSLSLSGVVLYANSVGIGIRFKHLTPNQHTELKSYLQAVRLATAEE